MKKVMVVKHIASEELDHILKKGINFSEYLRRDMFMAGAQKMSEDEKLKIEENSKNNNHNFQLNNHNFQLNIFYMYESEVNELKELSETLSHLINMHCNNEWFFREMKNKIDKILKL
jgi:hypothetical protein